MPGFFPRYLLSSSNMVTGCDQRSLDPFGVPMGVRNRKLRKTRSSSKQCWLGCSLRRPHPMTLGNPASYIQLLELALVICPFYFHIVSRLCSTSKSTFENFHLQKCTCTYLAKRLRELFSTNTGSYPHEFLCRTNCSACADYQP